jgi:hypothetical protein
MKFYRRKGPDARAACLSARVTRDWNDGVNYGLAKPPRGALGVLAQGAGRPENDSMKADDIERHTSPPIES